MSPVLPSSNAGLTDFSSEAEPNGVPQQLSPVESFQTFSPRSNANSLEEGSQEDEPVAPDFQELAVVELLGKDCLITLSSPIAVMDEYIWTLSFGNSVLDAKINGRSPRWPAQGNLQKQEISSSRSVAKSGRSDPVFLEIQDSILQGTTNPKSPFFLFLVESGYTESRRIDLIDYIVKLCRDDLPRGRHFTYHLTPANK